MDEKKNERFLVNVSEKWSGEIEEKRMTTKKLSEITVKKTRTTASLAREEV